MPLPIEWSSPAKIAVWLLGGSGVIAFTWVTGLAQWIWRHLVRVTRPEVPALSMTVSPTISPTITTQVSPVIQIAAPDRPVQNTFFAEEKEAYKKLLPALAELDRTVMRAHDLLDEPTSAWGPVRRALADFRQAWSAYNTALHTWRAFCAPAVYPALDELKNRLNQGLYNRADDAFYKARPPRAWLETAITQARETIEDRLAALKRTVVD